MPQPKHKMEMMGFYVWCSHNEKKKCIQEIQQQCVKCPGFSKYVYGRNRNYDKTEKLFAYVCMCVCTREQAKAHDHCGGYEVVLKILITGLSYNECFTRVDSASLMSMSNKSAPG